MRVVSLLPSLTEIVCALERGDKLVGRSHECDMPRGVRGLPICTRPLLDPAARSRLIDDRVKDLVQNALSLYEVDADRLRSLEPDVVLTQDHCEVCAASTADVERALADWTGKRPALISVAPSDLRGVFDSVRTIGRALGAERRARDLIRAWTGRITDIGEQSAAVGRRPRVACIEWLDPLMSAGNWIPEMVRIAGGEPLFGESGAHSPWLEWEVLREADPDVLVVFPCGFEIPRIRSEIGALTSLPGFAELRCVRDDRAFLADGNAFFNRPGPRLIESLEILADIVHPTTFDFGHAGGGYEALETRAP